ncbi:MFS family permease [Rhodococcus sp. BE178]
MYLSTVASDRYGRRPLAILGNVLMQAWAFPVFWIINTGDMVLVGIATFVAYGSAAAYITELFPAHVRSSGMTLLYQSASILISGSTPFITTALLARTGTTVSVSLYLAAMAAIALVSALLLPRDLPEAGLGG